ncbi:MAG: fimbrillin family protein [Muribaculaceae bacterium]|nr:fimbrillin family protein [Muribaculaceae bacterium]
MKKILFMMGVAAMALSSCSQEELVKVNNGKNDDNAISFRVRSYKPARAMEFSTYNLDDFMVFGFKGSPDDGDELISYFDGGLPVKFSRGNDLLFTSATPYYYPVDGSWLYFAAYAPSTLTGVESFGTLGGIKIDGFTVDPDITKQIDIICANGGSNLEPDEPDQELTFTHALTKVFVSEVANTDTRYKYEIIGVKFGNIHNSGDYEYRGDKAFDDVIRNGVFAEDGFIQDFTGNGHFWKPAGEQNGEMTYIFAEPVVLDKTTTRADVMSGDDTEATGEEANGAFMLIPQQLSAAFLNDEGTIDSASFTAGMSYIAFLVRITYLPTGEVIYPYAEGVEAISKTIGEGDDAITYAWAAFPVSSLWVPGSYIDYFVDFSKGAGFVAPGASEDFEFKPILGREIKFTEEVFSWDDGTLITVDQNNQLGVDSGEDEDPFGE